MIFIVGALLALAPGPAFSAGIELAWNHCFGQAGAQTMRTSACTSNTGSQSMFATFRPPAGVIALEGIEVIVEYQVPGGSMSCWWDFTAGALRNPQLSFLPVSPTDSNGNALVLCDNHYFLDRGATGEGAMTAIGSGCGRLRGTVAVTAGTGSAVGENTQEYGMGFRIANSDLSPAGTCPGCLQEVCFVLGSITLYSPGSPDVVLTSPQPGSNNWVTWQGNDLSTNCPFICGRHVPVHPSTWGRIKSIYR